MIHLWQVLAGCGIGIAAMTFVAIVIIEFANILNMFDDSGEW